MANDDQVAVDEKLMLHFVGCLKMVEPRGFVV